MIRVSRLADYAVVIMTALCESGERVVASAAVAETLKMPEPTVSKVLKLLAKAGLAVSVRGAGGGYTLEKGPEEISVASIVAAVDGPIALTSCVEGSDSRCDYTDFCPAFGRWDGVNRAVRTALEAVSLADMIKLPASPVKTGALKDTSFRSEDRRRGEEDSGVEVI